MCGLNNIWAEKRAKTRQTSADFRLKYKLALLTAFRDLWIADIGQQSVIIVLYRIVTCVLSADSAIVAGMLFSGVAGCQL